MIFFACNVRNGEPSRNHKLGRIQIPHHHLVERNRRRYGGRIHPASQNYSWLEEQPVSDMQFRRIRAKWSKISTAFDSKSAHFVIAYFELANHNTGMCIVILKVLLWFVNLNDAGHKFRTEVRAEAIQRVYSICAAEMISAFQKPRCNLHGETHTGRKSSRSSWQIVFSPSIQ